MANKVKLTFKEKWLVPFGIMKGNFTRYKSEYILNTGDREAIRDFCERKLTKRVVAGGRFDEDSVEGIHWYWDSQTTNALGQILVKEEVSLRFEPYEEGKTKVIHEEIDHVNNNARCNVEHGFLKTGLIKEFGLVE